MRVARPKDAVSEKSNQAAVPDILGKPGGDTFGSSEDDGLTNSPSAISNMMNAAQQPHPVPQPVQQQVQQQQQPVQKQPGSDATITHVLTDTETNLLFHAQAGVIDWGAEVAKIGDDYELMKDPLALPVECALKRERCEFAYRWLNPKNEDTFNQQTSGRIRWYVVTRDNAPYIKSVGFDQAGLIRNGSLVLAKMPWAMYAKRNQIYHTAAILPTKKPGPKDEEGKYEYTDGKLRSGDIVVSEERAFPNPGNPDVVSTRMVDVNQRWTGDPDRSGD